MLKRKLLDPISDFIEDEILGGLVLLAAAFAALIWANSAWSDSYFDLWGTYLSVGIGGLEIDLSLQHWVNDLLMAVFFFVVGAEIKREVVTGELRNPRDAAVPVLAAVGGVALPALVFVWIVGGGHGAEGWAIPTATDIAFVLGIIALLGRRIPSGVRIFMLTVAIVDDLIAITIIAVFYGDGFSLAWCAVAVAGLLSVVAFQRLGIWRIWPYVPLAALIWVGTFESGIHATIAGVVLGLLVPVRPFQGRDLHRRLELAFHPVSAFVVVPLFALANAGIDLGGGRLGEALSSELTWAVIGGLVVGKTLGIATTTLVAVKLGVGGLPTGMRQVHAWGLGALGGVGFTVSMFITELAFSDSALTDEAKIGIFLGSILAGALGALLLLSIRSQTDADT